MTVMAEMIRSPVVVLLLVIAIANNRWAFGGRLKEDECQSAGMSGSNKLYLAQNCRPKKCIPTAPIAGFTCSIGNYKDQMPGACREVERMLTARQTSPPPPAETTCQPLLTSLELYDFKCREVRSLVEKALRFSFILPLCNEGSIRSSQGIKVDFNADNKSLENYYTSHRICRTFNYSDSNFTLWTNRSLPIELADDCMAIGLQDGFPDVLYYLAFTEFPSGILVNYTIMFKDVKEESMRLLAGAWLTRQRAHFIFMQIQGVSNYTIEARSGSKAWTFSKEISSPSVIITDIPNSSSTITVTVTPNDKKACKELNYLCSPITLTLMDKNSLNLPIESSGSLHGEGETKWSWKHSVIVAVGILLAAALLVIALIIYRRRRYSGYRYSARFRLRPVLWIADPLQTNPVETYLRKRGVRLKHALGEDTNAAEQMRNHDIIILLLPSSLSISRPYSRMVQTILETKPLWKKVRVISYAEKDQAHLLPSSILRNQFRNHSHQLEFLQFLDNHVYRLPEEGRSLVENLTEHQQQAFFRFHREDVKRDEDVETVSLVSESVLSDMSVSYISESSERSERREVQRTGRRAPQLLGFERFIQAVPEMDEPGSDSYSEHLLPSSEVSQNSLSEALEGVGEHEDGQVLIHGEGSRQQGAQPDSQETLMKHPVEPQDASELGAESDLHPSSSDSMAVSYISESSERSECREVQRTGHRAPQKLLGFERFIQAVPEMDEPGSDSDSEHLLPSSEVSQNSLSEALEGVGEHEDGQVLIHGEGSRQQGAQPDSQETLMKQPVEPQDASELGAESDPQLHETLRKEPAEGNPDMFDPETFPKEPAEGNPDMFDPETFPKEPVEGNPEMFDPETFPKEPAEGNPDMFDPETFPKEPVEGNPDMFDPETFPKEPVEGNPEMFDPETFPKEPAEGNPDMFDPETFPKEPAEGNPDMFDPETFPKEPAEGNPDMFDPETFPKEPVEGNPGMADLEIESCPAGPGGEEDTERKQFLDGRPPEESDQTPSRQERNGHTPPLNNDPSSSDSMGPSGFADLAVDLRNEFSPMSSEREEDTRESHASSHRGESDLKSLPSDSKPEDTDASQRSRMSSMDSRGRFDHDPQNNQQDLDRTGSQCRPSALATQTDDRVKSEESMMSSEGSRQDNSDGKDSGGRVDGSHEHPPAGKESSEMQDVSDSGFVPKGPPSLLNLFPDSFPRAGGGDSGGNLSAGSRSGNQHAEKSSAPADKGASNGQLSRMLLELQGQGHREGLVDRHPHPRAEFDNYGDPDCVGELDERGERYFEPAFDEHEPLGPVDVSPERLPSSSSADVSGQPPLGAPDEPQKAFHQEPPGDGAGQPSPPFFQDPSASYSGLPSAGEEGPSSGPSSGHSPGGAASPSGNLQPADLGQGAALDFRQSPASHLQRGAVGAQHEHQAPGNPAQEHQQAPGNPAQEHHQQAPSNPAHHHHQAPGNPAQHHHQAPDNPAHHHHQAPGNPAHHHHQAPGNPAQHHHQAPGNPAQHLQAPGNPAHQAPGEGVAPLANGADRVLLAAGGQPGNRQGPVEHEWPPQNMGNDSGLYSMEEE